MEYTKGPWAVGEIDPTKIWSTEESVHDKTLIAVSTNEGQAKDFYRVKSKPEILANATLIASAPELLQHLGYLSKAVKEKRYNDADIINETCFDIIKKATGDI